MKKIVMGILAVGLGCLLSEALLAAVYFSPLSFPESLLEWKKVYYQHSMNTVQFMPECSRYDPELTYTLKPGKCTFSNREFITEIRVNTAGLRDDEESLKSPEIIALGDSHTMGWGVEHEETSPQKLEEYTGMKVLNAGVSSYGTVREMKLLDRLDTSALKYPVVQYHPNDYRENVTYFREGNRLPITSEKEYHEFADGLRERRHYHIGKYLKITMWYLWQSLRDGDIAGSQNPRDVENEAEMFLNVLVKAPPVKLDDHVRYIVVGDNEFIAQLKSKMGEYPRMMNRIVLLGFAAIRLVSEQGYMLDGHLKPGGHEIIAKEIARVILEEGQNIYGK